MPADFDAAYWAPAVGSVTSFNLTGLTVSPFGNGLLLAFITAFSAISAPTATWDSGGTNQAMTLVTSQANVGATVTTYMFRLVNPTPGKKTLAFSWTTASSNIGFMASSWVGVNQGAPTYTVVPGNGTSTTPNTTVFNVNAGDIATALLQTSTHSLLNVGNTPILVESSFGTGQNYTKTGGASVTLSGTASGSDNWISIGLAISAAEGGNSIDIRKVRSGGWDW
ncbi:MAG: hypothetical protein HRJ53_01980 [Acidobacteria bacterium Pan2503]|uniref:Uncharacterized protein n=1 Tax=Candidatus Acidiferrum panamense TaxID=2741543 RepID=A0A7V8NLX0_9BACT|nr:hypothetical protein [Candidatus Acidoferrum panamensis]